MFVSSELITARRDADVAYREFRAATGAAKFGAVNRWTAAQDALDALLAAGHRDQVSAFAALDQHFELV